MGGITASEGITVLLVSKALARFTLERFVLFPAEFTWLILSILSWPYVLSLSF